VLLRVLESSIVRDFVYFLTRAVPRGAGQSQSESKVSQVVDEWQILMIVIIKRARSDPALGTQGGVQVSKTRKVVRRGIVGAVAISLVAWTAACSSSGASPASTDSSGKTVVHIAQLSALTGNLSAAANEAHNRGIDWALEKVNATGHIRIDLDRQDTGGDQARAIALTRENAADDKIVLQIGPATSAEFFSVIPLAKSLHLPVYATFAGGTYPGDYNEWTFNTGFPDAAAIPILVKYAAKTLKAKKAAVLYVSDNDYGTTANKIFTSDAKKAGIDVTSAGFSAKDVDFSAQVTRLKATDPDVVFIAAQPQQSGFVIKAVRDGGIDVPTMSTDNAVGNHKLVFDNSQGTAEGHIVVTPVNPFSDRPQAKAYFEAFPKKFPGAEVSWDPYGYDGIMLLDKALESIKGDITRDKVRAALGKATLDGVTGEIAFPEGYGVASRSELDILQMGADGTLEPLR
jgi:branched-chain amino acid transport system substrate-binding protein